MQRFAIPSGVTEVHAALLQAAITLGLALLCAALYRRYGKPYFAWWAVAWGLYLLRLGAIASFLATRDWDWLYWHQVITGWTALALLWAALVFARQLAWRWTYAPLLLFPPLWSYVAIYRLDNFMLAAGPAVLFLSLVTFGTGGIFFRYARRVGSAGARMLAIALLLWGFHHLDYPFLRARGAWNPWGYYLDILFILAVGAGILVLVLDDQRRGLAALSALSGNLLRSDAGGGLGVLLEQTLTLPAARGAAMFTLEGPGPRLVRGVGACADWEQLDGPAAQAVRRAIEHGQPQFARGSAFPFTAVLPVIRDARAAAALVIVGDTRDPFTALDESFLLALGRQIGASLEGADLYRRVATRTADLERLSKRMLQQHEEERRRLSLELHDETAQVFTAMKLQLGLLRERANPDDAARLDRVLQLIDDGIVGIRSLTDDLRPSLLDDLGLVPALRSLALEFGERVGLAVDFAAPEVLPPLSEPTELALFRALQEALSNVTRHAGARAVGVRCAAEGGGVSLVVRDDGRGFAADLDLEQAEREGHLGLVGMRERISALGGTVTLERGAGAGVAIWVPGSAPTSA